MKLFKARKDFSFSFLKSFSIIIFEEVTMKFVIASFIFWSYLPSFAYQKFDRSVTEECSHASAEDGHNVQVSSYKRLLARLSGDEEKKEKGYERREGSGGGQR